MGHIVYNGIYLEYESPRQKPTDFITAITRGRLLDIYLVINIRLLRSQLTISNNFNVAI